MSATRFVVSLQGDAYLLTPFPKKAPWAAVFCPQRSAEENWFSANVVDHREGEAPAEPFGR